MICPVCRQSPLTPEYRRIPATQLLDVGHRQPQHDRELSALACPGCGSCWYALPGETPGIEFRRIQTEELHP